MSVYRRVSEYMKKGGRRKLLALIAITVVLLLAGEVTAFPPLLVILQSFEALWAVVWEKIGEIVVRITYAFFIQEVYFKPIEENYQHLPELILMNPQMMLESEGGFVGNTPVENLVNFFIKMTEPFYILAILAIAFYLLFVSGSPLGRARAKSSLIKLIISMGVIMLTVPIIQLLLDVSEYLTGSVLNLADIEPGIAVLQGSLNTLWWNFFGAAIFSYWNALYILIFTGVMFGGLLLLIGVRYFLVIMFTVLFPITVFMFAFYSSRRVGAQVFKQTLAWIFIQPLMALVLVAISTAAYSMPLMDDPAVKVSFGLGAAMALLVSPLIATHVMDWMAMLMIMLTGLEFPGMHGLIGMIDELQIEGLEEEEITPPPPIRPRGIPGNR